MPTDKNREQVSQKPTSQDSPGGRRKRESRAGTRSVSMLSPAQLERKRANDREAQRTIRQRNKEHIENLERQVIDLTGKKDQLDAALQQNAMLEAEIDRLKQQLASLHHQIQYAEASAFAAAPETMAGSSRTGSVQHDMMVQRGSFSPMSQSSQTIVGDSQIDSNMGIPVNASWNPYMLTPQSSGSDKFATRGIQHTLQGQMMHPHGRDGMMSHSSAMMYGHQSQHHQNQSPP